MLGTTMKSECLEWREVCRGDLYPISMLLFYIVKSYILLMLLLLVFSPFVTPATCSLFSFYLEIVRYNNNGLLVLDANYCYLSCCQHQNNCSLMLLPLLVIILLLPLGKLGETTAA